MVLMGMVKYSQSSQNSKFSMSLQYLKKEVRDEVEFLHADKHQSFLQVDFNNLGIKVSYKVILSLLIVIIKHSQSTQSNKFAIYLQYIKKEISNGIHFLHADKHQSFYKLALSFLMEVDRHVQITQNRKSNFLQYFKKGVSQLLCSIVMQNIQIFYGGPVMFIVTCFTPKISVPGFAKWCTLHMYIIYFFGVGMILDMIMLTHVCIFFPRFKFKSPKVFWFLSFYTV